MRRFEPLSADQVVPIIKGIQGGYHVWGAFTGGGFDDLDVRIVFELSLDGEVIADADYTELELPRNRSGDFDYAGVAVIYYQNERVEPSSGREMRLSLTVTTRGGLTLTDEEQLRPTCCD